MLVNEEALSRIPQTLRLLLDDEQERFIESDRQLETNERYRWLLTNAKNYELSEQEQLIVLRMCAASTKYRSDDNLVDYEIVRDVIRQQLMLEVSVGQRLSAQPIYHCLLDIDTMELAVYIDNHSNNYTKVYDYRQLGLDEDSWSEIVKNQVTFHNICRKVF